MTKYTEEIVKIESANLINAMSAWLPSLESLAKTTLEVSTATNQALITMLEWNLPILTENATQYMAEFLTLQQETMQAIYEWDMPSKMDGLNGMLSEAFLINQEQLLSVLAWDIPIQIGLLSSNIGTYISNQNEVIKVLTSDLIGNLSIFFAIQRELLWALNNEAIFNLKDNFTIQNDLICSKFTQNIESFSNTINIQTNSLTTKIDDLSNGIKESLCDYLTDLKISINLGIDFLASKQNDIKNSLKEILKCAKYIFYTAVDLFWANSSFFEKTLPKIVDDTNEIRSIQLAEEANRIATAGLMVSVIGLGLDSLSFLWDLLTGTIDVVGSLLTMGLLADGGIPGYGELFIAREAGPEFVGSFGSRNVVMNNNQIVDAVSGGVYDAVRRANAEQSQQPIYLNVEAKVRENVLFDMMETVRAERGVRLSTGGAW